MKDPELNETQEAKPNSFFKEKKKSKAIYFLIVVLILIFAPIVFFILQFNVGFFDTVSEWGDVGSFFGGVYTPILSFLTLFLLLFQSSIMKFQMNLMKAQTNLQESQLEIQRNILEKEDVASRTTKALTSTARLKSALESEVESVVFNKKISRLVLLNNAVQVFEKSPEKFQRDKHAYQTELHDVFANWVLVLGNIWDIENVATDEYLMKNSQEALSLEVVTLLGFETCKTLDRFLKAIGHPYSNREKYPPFFWSKV